MKVGQTSVNRAKKVRSKGAPEVIAAVQAGEVSVNAASEIVDEGDHEVQRQKLRDHKVRKPRKSANVRKRSGGDRAYAVAIMLLNVEWKKAGLSARQDFFHEHFEEWWNNLGEPEKQSLIRKHSKELLTLLGVGSAEQPVDQDEVAVAS